MYDTRGIKVNKLTKMSKITAVEASKGVPGFVHRETDG